MLRRKSYLFTMHRAAVATLFGALIPGLSGVLPVAAQPSTAVAASAAAAQDWRRGAVCYEVFVRSFYDSNGDGVGDLNGLIQKLDYINDGTPDSRRDLGARCIWLMPIAASPSYHGYDVTDYYRVDREYGTNEDFRRLIAEAHRRGIRVLVDLVLNHTSSEHPAFEEAQRDPASPFRRWFRWLPAHPGVKNQWGGDNWHRSSVRGDYYYGFFWSGMPDLNYETPAVREEAKKISRFWLTEMGADGFRLDAIAHLVEEGQTIKHAPGIHPVLRDYASYIRRIAPRAFTIGEVWDSTGAMLAYYPDQLDAYFAFEVSDSIVAAVRTGSAKTLLPPVLRLQRALPAERWGTFLRNHDQTRTLTALGGDTARARVAATLLLTLPGLPFVYYGEELGMTGDKPDERLRTPMHWRRERAGGFTTGRAWQALQPDSLTANIEAQDRDPRSLLNFYRRLIHLRAGNPALASGKMIELEATSGAVAAFLRREGDRAVLVASNLGSAPLREVRVSSAEWVLRPGRYVPKDLLTRRAAVPMRVGRDGRIRSQVVLSVLRPMSAYVFELERQGR